MKRYRNKDEATERVTILVDKIRTSLTIQQMQERIIDASIKEIQDLYEEYPDIDNRIYQELIQEDEKDTALIETSVICK